MKLRKLITELKSYSFIPLINKLFKFFDQLSESENACFNYTYIECKQINRNL